MKHKMKFKFSLITFIVLTAFAAAALAAFFSCRASGEDDDDQLFELPIPTVELASLSLRPKSGEVLGDELIVDFDSLNPAYTVNLDASGGRLFLQLEPKLPDNTEIQISVNWVQVSTSKSAEFSAPLAGAPSMDVSIYLTNTETYEFSEYRIILIPPQSNAGNIKTLQSLDIRYTSTENPLISFSPGVTAYSFNADQGRTHFIVKARATSSAASVEIKYDGVSVAGGDGVSEAEVTLELPAAGQNKTLSVIVNALEESVGSQPYNVNVGGYHGQADTWTGSVSYTGTAYPNIVVEAVTGRAVLVGNTQSAVLGTHGSKNSSWTINSPQAWMPSTFLVTLVDTQDDTVYLSGAIRVENPSTDNSIMLEVTDANIGVVIYNAINFKDYLGSTSGNSTNYSLANDINLSEVSGAWSGPTNYAGHFYGNGYTISGLVLADTSGAVGLFNTLNNGAVLEDFTVDVTTKDNVANGSVGTIYFGGVVGELTKSVTLKKITVQGLLEFGNHNQKWAVIGGLLGGVNHSSPTILIENCVSKLNILVKAGTISDNNASNFGGLIGISRGNVTIRNSYTTGNIDITKTGNQIICAGGLVGANGHTGDGGYSLNINNSYATGAIKITSNRASWSYSVYSGGLVGAASNNCNLSITNSAALNSSVLTIIPSEYVAAWARYGRLVGGFHSTGSGTKTFVNNRAISPMELGDVAGGNAAVEDEGADSAGALSVTLGNFKNQATWTAASPSGLGWSEAVWDFSGLSAEHWPALK